MHDWQSEVRARLAPLNLKPEREADIVDEIAQHLAERYREAISAGESPDEATRLALAEFHAGNVLAQRIAALRQAHAPAAVTLGASTGHLLADLKQDLRYAFRSFAKQPGFSATVVLILALGLGATTAIFSVVNGIFLRPLPYSNAERLMQPLAIFASGFQVGSFSYPNFEDLRDQNRTFAGLAAYVIRDASVAMGEQ